MIHLPGLPAVMQGFGWVEMFSVRGRDVPVER